MFELPAILTTLGIAYVAGVWTFARSEPETFYPIRLAFVFVPVVVATALIIYNAGVLGAESRVFGAAEPGSYTKVVNAIREVYAPAAVIFALIAVFVCTAILVALLEQAEATKKMNAEKNKPEGDGAL